MAFQRGYFLNLPIFSGRRRPYTEVDPEEARALFIRDALVPGEINGRFEFIEHNLAQLEAVLKLEHKIRRHDVLISDQTLANFYARQLPANVLSESSLRQWLKSLSEDERQALFLEQEDLFKRELSRDELDLPDSMRHGDHQLPLDYHFGPGEAHDGISARIPLPLLNQLSQADFDKLVPGYLTEKIEYLIRSLPKVVRKQLVPIPDTVAAVEQALRNDTRPLLEALATMLNQRANLRLSAADFKPAELPDHLTMNLVLVDEAGDELGRANALNALQGQFGVQAKQSIASVEHDWQQTGLKAWEFEDLPESILVGTHGLETRAYPALVDATAHVNLQLFDDPAEARVSHRQGVVRLLQLDTGFGRKLEKRPLPYWQTISLRYSPIGSHLDLRAALLDSVLQSLLFEKGDDIRSKAQFFAHSERAEQQFNHAIEPYCKALEQALNAYGSLSSALGSAAMPDQSREDIQTQLDYLIYEDFLVEVPLSSVLNYPVFFRALEKRMERLAYDPQGDLKKLDQLSLYWNQYLQNWEMNPHNEALDAYRWLLEVYRVSLFAPTLKTPVPVSPKRLDAAWQLFLDSTLS